MSDAASIIQAGSEQRTRIWETGFAAKQRALAALGDNITKLGEIPSMFQKAKEEKEIKELQDNVAAAMAGGGDMESVIGTLGNLQTTTPGSTRAKLELALKLRDSNLEQKNKQADLDIRNKALQHGVAADKLAAEKEAYKQKKEQELDQAYTDAAQGAEKADLGRRAQTTGMSQLRRPDVFSEPTLEDMALEDRDIAARLTASGFGKEGLAYLKESGALQAIIQRGSASEAREATAKATLTSKEEQAELNRKAAADRLQTRINANLVAAHNDAQARAKRQANAEENKLVIAKMAQESATESRQVKLAIAQLIQENTGINQDVAIKARALGNEQTNMGHLAYAAIQQFLRTGDPEQLIMAESYIAKGKAIENQVFELVNSIERQKFKMSGDETPAADVPQTRKAKIEELLRRHGGGN